MTRILLIAALGLTALGVSGCPNPSKNDAGDPDAFFVVSPPPIDACSGGCAVNQYCDTVTRVCKDGCGGCSDGGICQKQPSGQFACLPTVIVCNGITCGEGEVACIAGQCTCLGPARGVVDTCYTASGERCGADGKCRAPRALEECDKTRAQCGNAGGLCNPVFGENLSICTQDCSNSKPCGRGDRCASFDNQGMLMGCLPDTLFSGFDCEIQVDAGVLPDGGNQALRRITVPVANKCLVKDMAGSPTEVLPTGNCTYAFFQFKDQTNYSFATCRPPGNALENAECKQDWADTQRAFQCSSGLECALTRGSEKGVCLRACNARPPSIDYPNPTPTCGGGESCVNIYRKEDTNMDSSVLGVCMKSCNSFANDGGDTCPNYGAIASSCLPTDPSGRLLVSNDGTGVCMPQNAGIGAVDMPCAQVDPLLGASCPTNTVCAPATSTEQPLCRKVCDTRCSGGDAGVPAFCGSEHNATCSGGKSCQRVTSTVNAYLGFCL